MKTRWNLIGVALITFSLLGAFTAYGRHGDGPGKHHHGREGAGFPFKILKALDLTDEQQKQVDAVWESRRETMKTLRGELRTTHREIMDKLLAPGEVTAADLAPQTERATQLEAQLFNERLALGLDIRQVLTPEQIAKAGEIIAEKRARHAERKESAQEKP